MRGYKGTLQRFVWRRFRGWWERGSRDDPFGIVYGFVLPVFQVAVPVGPVPRAVTDVALDLSFGELVRERGGSAVGE